MEKAPGLDFQVLAILKVLKDLVALANFVRELFIACQDHQQPLSSEDPEFGVQNATTGNPKACTRTPAVIIKSILLIAVLLFLAVVFIFDIVFFVNFENYER